MTEETADKSVEKLAAELYPKGQYPLGKPLAAVAVAANEDPFPEDTDDLMADIVARANLMKAYQRVRGNKGAPGVDGVSVQALKAQLQAHWPRIKAELLSGEYQPQPVRAVAIPKPGGGTRTLGIPTVSDRIAQTVVTLVLEPLLEPVFHADSYGYRPGRSAHDALAVTRKRCWQRDWVLEYDIRGLFDNIDHQLLLKALRHHCDERWVLLHVERWLTAPMLLSVSRFGVPTGRGLHRPVDRSLGHEEIQAFARS